MGECYKWIQKLHALVRLAESIIGEIEGGRLRTWIPRTGCDWWKKGRNHG